MIKRLASFLAIAAFFLSTLGLSTAHGQPKDISGKIVGGSPIAITEVPWQVQVAFQKSGSWYSCGGVLIGPDAVLTAAHCATNQSDDSPLLPGAFRVAMGSAQYSS